MTRRIIQAPGVAVAASLMLAAVALAAVTPTVSTGSVTNRTETSATLNATVNPQGAATTWYFQYGLTNNPYSSNTVPKTTGSGTKPVSVSATISGLTPGTVYHYRIVGASRAGSAIGADRTFKTAGHPLAQPVTGGATNLGRNSATVTGAVNTEGQTTTWEFQYGLSTAYGATSSGGTVPASAAPVPVSDNLAGLAPGTTFHYRLIAFHGTFVSYGADQTFFTFPFPRLHGSLHARTLPLIAASKPYVFVTTGSLTTPAGLPAGVACNGVVRVRFFVGHKTVATRTTSVLPNCTFSTQVTFHRLIRGKPRRVGVTVRFHGNNYLVPALASSQRVRLGI
jgi:phosphodiesterase/alkaline phosphatase D-like protein